MATSTDVGFVEMRLAKVVSLAASPEDDEGSQFVVLDGVSQDRQLPIQIGPAEAFTLAAALTGVELRPPILDVSVCSPARAGGGCGSSR